MIILRGILLLPIILWIHGIETKTKWHFNGKLGCPLDVFNYHVEVYEQDFIKKWDDLLTNQTMIHSNRPHSYKVDAEDTSDGLDFGRKFEIYMLIFHNCTSNGSMKTIRFDWGTFNIDTWEVTKSQNVELFNKGDDI